LFPQPPTSYTLSLHDALPISARDGMSASSTLSWRPAVSLAPPAVGSLDLLDFACSYLLQSRLCPLHRAPAATAFGVITQCGVIKDRKSTRLNSSHDQISYAVF